MKSIGSFFARLLEVPVAEDAKQAGSASCDDPISVLAKESAHTVDARTDAEVLSEIKAWLQQEAWISGRGFLY